MHASAASTDNQYSNTIEVEYSNATVDQVKVEENVNKDKSKKKDRARVEVTQAPHHEEEVYASVKPGRDSFYIHEDIRIQFEDIFAEPIEQAESYEDVWKFSNKAYSGTRFWCYRITTLLLGVPAAVCWGVVFACTVFCRIWCCMPLLRCYHVQQTCSRLCCQSFVNSYVAPCHEAFGWIFHHIKVQLIRGTNSP